MKYHIGDLAKILGISTNTIRRYEKMGHIYSVRDEESGYRSYDDTAVFKLNNSRLLRKHCFTHEELNDMREFDLEQMISCYEQKMSELEEKIQYLTYVRHRIKDDLLLMKKAFSDVPVYRKDNMHQVFVLYKQDGKILTEPGRLAKIQEFLYQSPEVQHIGIIRKAQLEQGKLVIDLGWAIKEMHREKYGLTENEYTENYYSKPSLMGFVKIPMNRISDSTDDGQEKKELLLGRHLKYIEENLLSITGDIILIAFSQTREKDMDCVELLVSVPIG